MDPAEKRRLKKLGKQRVEEQSRELQERLAESNPAPIGSDEWAKNYRQGTLKEKELRQQQPDIIHSHEIDCDFVLNPIDPVAHGVPTYYIQCVQCGDVLHSCPQQSVTCSCSKLSISLDDDQTVITAESKARIQWVKLIGKSTAELGFANENASRSPNRNRWWQFWR